MFKGVRRKVFAKGTVADKVILLLELLLSFLTGADLIDITNGHLESTMMQKHRGRKDIETKKKEKSCFQLPCYMMVRYSQ